MNTGDIITLIGRPTSKFVVVETYLAAGFIPAVRCFSADGKWQTTARVADVVVCSIAP